jgi:hypothetical protein
VVIASPLTTTQVMMLPIDVVVAGKQPIAEKRPGQLAEPLGNFAGVLPPSVFGERD